MIKITIDEGKFPKGVNKGVIMLLKNGDKECLNN
jgi:hypothetical protein